MKIEVTKTNGVYDFQLFNDEGRIVSQANARVMTSRLNGAEIKSLIIGGVLTDPENRRGGLVRYLFNEMHKWGEKNGCLVSILHPFSFEYYRKFGYEYVSDHCVLEFPMASLGFVSRYNNLRRYDDVSMASDLLEIYNAFAKNRNIMLERTVENYPIPTDGKKIYILYDENNKPKAYISLFDETRFEINHSVSVNLHIYEMCFTSQEDLMKLFGFMRMFEGNLESVKIHDSGMTPEIELMLRHYEHMSIRRYPDISVRICDTAGVLSAVQYPMKKGAFTVKVTEPERSEHSNKNTAGIFKVDYENGSGKVTKLPDNADFDFETDIATLTQLIYGFNSYGYEVARYSRNIKFNNECYDFFRAFPNRPCGAYDHF